MNDLEAEDILSFIAGDNFEVACEQHGRQTVLDAITHAAKVLRERAAAEPVAWMSLGKYDDDEEWELSFGPSFPNGHDDAPIPLYTAPQSTAPEGLVRFVRMWDEKPLRGRDQDLIYAIHTGTEWEAELRVSDLREAIGDA